MLIAGGVSALLATVLYVVRRRRLGTGEEARRLAEALRTGELPDGADRDHWRHRLDADRRLNQRFTAIIAVLGLIAVACALAGVLLLPDQRVVGVVLAAVFAAASLTGAVLTRRNSQRARRLRARLGY